jgi:NAD(P)-dependent dehydrogenase (short-subunit alcohol dehydrogenase family)
VGIGVTALHGAIAFVTGAAGGIGAAAVDALRRAGSTVVTCDLPGRGCDAEVDVRDGPALHAAFASACAKHGRVDVAVAAAGIGAAGVVEALDDDAWQRSIDVNLWGTVNTVRAAYPAMVAQHHGHVVLVASLSGLVPTPLLVPYATAKSAVVGLGTSLAPEARRHGVGVTVVCPGPVDTAMLDGGGAGGSVVGVDVRRYLSAAAGRPLPPSTIADALVRAVERDRLVVAPGRAGVLWRLTRVSPALAMAGVGRAMRDELARQRAGHA